MPGGDPQDAGANRVPEWDPAITVGVRGTEPSKRVDATFLKEEPEVCMKR